MKDETTVPEMKSLFKQVTEEPERMFEMLQIDIKRQAERAVTELMKAELTEFLGRGRYEREDFEDGEERPNYRIGSYRRTFATQALGELELEVPRERNGEFQKYIIVDGVQFPMRTGHTVEKIPMLVASTPPALSSALWTASQGLST